MLSPFSHCADIENNQDLFNFSPRFSCHVHTKQPALMKIHTVASFYLPQIHGSALHSVYTGYPLHLISV